MDSAECLHDRRERKAGATKAHSKLHIRAQCVCVCAQDGRMGWVPYRLRAGDGQQGFACRGSAIKRSAQYKQDHASNTNLALSLNGFHTEVQKWFPMYIT